jgi:K+-transporting ATPase ATPase A chain
MLGRPKEGWMLFGVMAFLFVVGFSVMLALEQSGDADLTSGVGMEASADGDQPGGNMEGKEVRFGVSGSVLAATATSDGATGSFNSMHDSYTPLANGVALMNMLTGELIFGGVGTGLTSMLMLVLITLFMAGLMIGRTPEYLGKKLTPEAVKRVALYIIVYPATVLLLTAVAAVVEAGRAGLTANDGAHGFTQLLFAYASATANNGLTMASLNANSEFFNLTTSLAMAVGRFVPVVLTLALAGILVQQPRRPATFATLPTTSGAFITMLLAVIVIVGGLSYFIAIALGPIADQVSGG